MTDAVHWMLAATIKDGQQENFKTVMHDMVESTRNEPGTHNYEWFVGGDGKTVNVYERYADSAAVMAHITTFGEKFAERLLAVVEPTGFVVYGNPSDDVRAALAGFGAVHMGQVAGFAR